MAPTRGTRIAAPGLADLRRDLGRISRDLRVALDAELRVMGNEARDRARTLLRERSKNPQGRIERTIRTSVSRGGVAIYSRHPGAAPIQWGGVIKPRGTPIKLVGKRYMSEAVGEGLEELEDRLGVAFDNIVPRYQFRKQLMEERASFADFWQQASQ